jgi:hypothetical protein
LAAFSCETDVEQHPQHEEKPHNRNSEPPAILLCHESPARSLPSGTGMIAFRFRENCAAQHVPSEKGPPRFVPGGPIRFGKAVRTPEPPAGRADDRLAADVSPVHQHTVSTDCAYSGCACCRSSYCRCSSDRSTCRSARNAGSAHRRRRPADPGLRATCGQ